MESESLESDVPGPRILSVLDGATLQKFYPKDAERHGIEGLVTVAIALDSEGRATRVKILAETPPAMGFGAAASSLAHSMTYSNPAAVPVIFKLKVKFALNDAQRARGSPRH